jgi:hypothetical protein
MIFFAVRYPTSPISFSPLCSGHFPEYFVFKLLCFMVFSQNLKKNKKHISQPFKTITKCK